MPKRPTRGPRGGKGKPKEGKGKPEKAKPEKRQKHAAVEAAPGAAEGCDAWWKEKVLAPRVTHAVSGVVRAYITGTTRSRPKRSLIVELTQRNTPRYLEIVTEWQEKIKKQKVTKEMAKQWRSELLDVHKGVSRWARVARPPEWGEARGRMPAGEKCSPPACDSSPILALI